MKSELLESRQSCATLEARHIAQQVPTRKMDRSKDPTAPFLSYGCLVVRCCRPFAPIWNRGQSRVQVIMRDCRLGSKHSSERSPNSRRQMRDFVANWPNTIFFSFKKKRKCGGNRRNFEQHGSSTLLCSYCRCKQSFELLRPRYTPVSSGTTKLVGMCRPGRRGDSLIA
jgi:hypothetical protein